MALYQASPSSAGGSPLSRPRNAYKKARRFLRKHAQSVWATAFIALAAGFYVWAAWLTYDFATYALQPAGGLIWKHATGHAAAVAFAFAAARYFFRIGLGILPSAATPDSSAACLAGYLPSALAWAMLTAVTVPVTMAIAFAENPGLAVLYLVSLIGVTATVLGFQTVQKCVPPVTPHHPDPEASSKATAGAGSQRTLSTIASSTQDSLVTRARTVASCTAPIVTRHHPSAPPPSHLPHRHSRSVDPAGADENWLECLRTAHVNMGAVKSLYKAGYRSLDDLRRAEDGTLLAIRGIGPATLRKIRRQLKGADAVVQGLYPQG